ncbi:hypothetical protein T492DRAFT_1060176 [Pavlovales sp. CCMP2436]|nr:hypothetical protein T492DRAFT_1060176 [Pavlovales sp. CCMP2436]
MPLVTGPPALALLRRCNVARASSRAGKLPVEMPSQSKLFLHVAPDGDHWTGPSIFAAKHLASDFMVSISLPAGFDPEQLTQAQLTEIYDTKKLPSDVSASPESSGHP